MTRFTAPDSTCLSSPCRARPCPRFSGSACPTSTAGPASPARARPSTPTAPCSSKSTSSRVSSSGPFGGGRGRGRGSRHTPGGRRLRPECAVQEADVGDARAPPLPPRWSPRSRPGHPPRMPPRSAAFPHPRMEGTEREGRRRAGSAHGPRGAHGDKDPTEPSGARAALVVTDAARTAFAPAPRPAPRSGRRIIR